MVTGTARVRAPELTGAGGWINASAHLSLEQLRGRAVLLDFWTFCCINCLRVIEEVRPLEEQFGDRLVVIGIHSPKFSHESDHEAVRRAVERHRITHPVLDDPDLRTWERYGVRAWPTLVVIDPDGYVVAQAAGEGKAAELGAIIAASLEGRDLPPNPAYAPQANAARRELSFPGKVASDGAGNIAIADTGHDRVLVCRIDGSVAHTFDGFTQPQGVRFNGDRLLVCNTVAGSVVAVPLDGAQRSTIADGMRSPWDIAVLPDGDIAVAEAGLHRLLRIPSTGGNWTVLAGTRAEGLRDGPADHAHLAQPSGLTVLPGGSIAIADSEVSALRVLRDGRMETLVGEGLFEWGDDDGDSSHARLQHPLGVVALPEGAIAIADTFNSLVRLWRDGRLSTVRIEVALDEPGGLDVLPDGRLVVADTNHHRVLLVEVESGTAEEIRIGAARGIQGERAATLSGPAVSGRSGASLELSLPELDLDGETLDPSQGPPVRVRVSAAPAELLEGELHSWALDRLDAPITLVLGRGGSGMLLTEVVAATCSEDVCTLHRVRERRALSVRPD